MFTFYFGDKKVEVEKIKFNVSHIQCVVRMGDYIVPIYNRRYGDDIDDIYFVEKDALDFDKTLGEQLCDEIDSRLAEYLVFVKSGWINEGDELRFTRNNPWVE